MLRAALAVCLLTLGVAVTLYGLYLAWPPLAYVAGGLTLVALALTREAGAEA